MIKNLLCLLGLHQWTTWKTNDGVLEVYHGKEDSVPHKRYILQKRCCKNCNLEVRRREKI